MDRWVLRLLRLVGRLVTASQFARAVSTAAIKTVGGSWHRPLSLSLS
jgi:hypothetical protein